MATPVPVKGEETRSLRHVRAAQLRARAVRGALGRLALGSLFLIGALSYAVVPDRHNRTNTTWMAALVVLSTFNVALGLRTLARVRRGSPRWWPWATGAWGVLATLLLWLLLRS